MESTALTTTLDWVSSAADPRALSAPPPAIGMRRRRDVGAANGGRYLLVVLRSGCGEPGAVSTRPSELDRRPIKRKASFTKVRLPCSRAWGTRTGRPSGSTRTAAGFPGRADRLELSVPGRRHGSAEMIVGLSGAHGRSRRIAGLDSRGPDRRSHLLWKAGSGRAADMRQYDRAGAGLRLHRIRNAQPSTASLASRPG